jgi:DNA-binding MarR family transcriptional regulator
LEAVLKPINPSEEQYRVKKPITHPFQTYPQLGRYLTGAQYKVANYLLMHGASNGRAFPSNRTLGFESGLTKGTVANVKMELVKLGLLTKEIIKEGNRTIWLYTLDVEWRSEQYLKDHAKEFNSHIPAKNPTIAEEIASLAATLAAAAPEDQSAILEKIRKLTSKAQETQSVNNNAPTQNDASKEQETANEPQKENIKSEPKTSKDDKNKAPQAQTSIVDSELPSAENKEKPPKDSPPIDEGLIDYILNQQKDVQNRSAYKSKLRRLIAEGKFEGLEDYQSAYRQKQVLNKIKKQIIKEKITVDIYQIKRKFDGEVFFDGDQECFMAVFEGYKVPISRELIDRALKDENKNGGSPP